MDASSESALRSGVFKACAGLTVSQDEVQVIMVDVDEAVEYLEKARVVRAFFQVHRGEAYSRIQLASAADRKVRVSCAKGPVNIASAVFHRFFGSPTWMTSTSVNQIVGIVAKEIAAAIPDVMSGLQGQAERAVQKAVLDDGVVGPVKDKIKSQRLKDREKGVAAVKKLIAKHGLQNEDVLRAWNEHLVLEVLRS